MRTMTPLERRVLTILGSEQRWWSLTELYNELDEDPYMSIVGALRELRHARLALRSADGADRYAITQLGEGELARCAA